jgi:uncharacterized protein
MPAQVEQLGPQHLDALRAMLAREPAHNMYLLGILEEFGIVPRKGRTPFAYWGRMLAGELTAAVFVGSTGGLIVPSASTTIAIGDIARSLEGKVQLQSAVGDKAAVDALLNKLGPKRVKISRTQRLFAVSADDLGPFTNPLMRLATEADLPRLVPMAAAAVEEMLDREPLQEDPRGFEHRVALRVKHKRTYLYEEGGRLVFKLDVGSRSQYGAELEALYTIPDERRKGLATLCLGQMSRHLLSSLPKLTIRVDDDNPQLATVARKVGYLAGRAQRLVVAS